jgi:succinate dehydrogenase/fumarate reductase flavoprotein subunit/uncharacterized protein with FMN-binding domain
MRLSYQRFEAYGTPRFQTSAPMRNRDMPDRVVPVTPPASPCGNPHPGAPAPDRKGDIMERIALNRRHFLGAASLATAATLAGTRLAPAARSAYADEKPQLTPGAYTASWPGRNGDVTVTTLVGADSIVKIEVADHTESAQFGAKCLDEMPQQMVDAQSVQVDTFTGATITSNALKAAVADCLGQAGDAGAFSEPPATGDAEDVELACDVVVVGSGISGMAAALSAAQEGARVIMLEKLSLSGGAATGSGGAVLAAGSSLQSEEDGNMDPEGLIENLYRYSEEKANLDVIKHIVAHSAEIIDWYVGLGVEFEVGQCYGTEIHYAHRAWNPDHSGKSGSNIFNRTYPAFLAAGGTCLLKTRATEVLQDETGAVTGVVATSGPRTYTIACNACVLAAGGYEGDAERLAEWSPHCGMQMVDSLCHVGDQGDGILMGIAAGGYFVGTGYGQTTAAYNPVAAIKVTAAGERYCDETHSEDGLDQGYQFKAFYDADAQWTYTLYDSSTLDENAANQLELAQKSGDIYKGETLAEVAEAAGVDPAGLEATVERWNAMVEAGVDEDFGCQSVAEIGTYEDGPFFLVPYTMVINGTVGGLKIDDESQVLREDGTPIEGLYAAGETCNGEYYYRLYPSGGASLLFGSVTGKIAGRNAAAIAASKK